MSLGKKIKWLIINGFFGWESTKWFIREIQATFSNKPSYFARKRIESFMLFINATVILDLFCIKNWNRISSAEILAIFTAQMVYAGYQVAQIRKDILTLPESKIDKPTNEESAIGTTDEQTG